MIKLRRLDTIAAFLLAALIAIPFLFGSGGGLYAAATSDVVSTYEAQNVLDDLQGTTIDGEKIDLSEYYFDNSKNVKVLSFVEFGYSFNTGNQDDYGLYVYVYNPRGLDFTTNQSLNKISFKYGDKMAYDKYSLDYLNRSTKKGYEGLFYKFKIALTATQRSDILQTLDNSSRVYDVSEIELCSAGNFNATAYDVANVYTYTGYAAGYGSDFDSEESTLACASKDSVTLSLDVHGAAYRPEGTNGKNNYTQDMLHSVYFSIPNSFINEYGEMTAVHATWLNAKTAPIFVTGNEDVYNSLYKIIFPEGDEVPTFNYALLANAVKHDSVLYDNMNYYYSDIAINVDNVTTQCSDAAAWQTQVYGFQNVKDTGSGQTAEIYNSLHYAFKAPNSIADINNADHYTLPGEKILEYIRNYSKSDGSSGGLIGGGNSGDNSGEGGFGGGGGSGRNVSELVAGKYKKELFEIWDDKFTNVNIKADNTYSLTSEELSQNWWQKHFTGGSTVSSSTTFDGIKAIRKIEASDFTGNTENICKSLYIDKSYYSDFKSFYDTATAKDETVYLFRYYQSEYESREITEFERVTSSLSFPDASKYALNKLDTNAYLAQEIVSLDFDIIDVTLTKDDVSTVIACVSSPIDIVPDVTPPVNTTPDEVPLWRKIVVIAVIIVTVIVVFKLLFGRKKGKK